MRVFAGPNGSGKSTIINEIQKTKVNGKHVDFGIYINADDIAKKLKQSKLDFTTYKIHTNEQEFLTYSLESGLVGKYFSSSEFKNSFIFQNNTIQLTNHHDLDRISQIVAHFIRKKLLNNKSKFSFETVFSHQSKLDIMQEARSLGYKVYLYFIATKDPEINKYRVQLRVKQGGHDVPEDKIESRYYRSLDLLFDAAQIAYQCFFFDNSDGNPASKFFAHFKVVNGNKKWTIEKSIVPPWFIKYYSDKVELH